MKSSSRMEPSPFIGEFNRVLRGLDPTDMRFLRSREPSCIQALVACRKRCRSDAQSALEQYASRQIAEDAEWIYDDFLLFAFLCVLIQFGDFRDTVGKIVSFRRRSEQSRKLTFIQDAERIAQSNAFTANSMFAVVIADLLEKPVSDPAVLREAHRDAVQSAHNGRVTAFERTIASRCQEVVAELSINSSMSSSVIARNLWRRCCFTAAAIYWLLFTVVAVATGWIYWLYFFGGSRSSSWAEKVVAVGATGLAFLIWAGRKKGCANIAFTFIWILAGSSSRRAMQSLVGDSQVRKPGPD